MRASLNRRLSMLTVGLVVLGVLLLARLASFQFQLDMASYLQTIANRSYRTLDDRFPDRGRIFDRNGELFAGNTTEYRIGVSPVYVSNPQKLAQDLAAILNDDPQRLLDIFASNDPYRALTRLPVSVEVAQKIAALESIAVRIDPEPKRIYPQSSLAAQIVGFVGWDGTIRRGYVGVEGGYNADLAGESRITERSRIPFEVVANDEPPPGKDIYLTIDRDIQFLAERQLLDAITTYGAVGGTILISDPRTGEILAMASYPTFDPNNYYTIDADLMKNPAVSDGYEPGSVFKIVTAAVALQSGRVNENSTYFEGSNSREIGGRRVYNWDRAAHGSQSFVDILVRSWNLGTTWLSVDILGADDFYKGLLAFGVGAPTGIDLEGEASGQLRTPGALYWSDSDLATNSFGQGLTVTPLQMLAFLNTIANDGQMMQPHIRLKTVDNGVVIPSIPTAIRTPVSADVARRITAIMVKVINEGEGSPGKLPGYTIAGKTGTAQIYCATCPGLYDPELQMATFVAFLPADEPRVSVLIKLDKVSRFASETAAPAFATLAKELVVLMNIPTDEQRAILREQGGDTAMIVGR
ncbi:MAG TPA: penicillin-binding protein 2 [Aggregatilineales bacterium]|nr:penicillin-binding protein 2 [Anaerolineales bacterium]HRE49495.1 penicillin-binding protein 2 [Aggregatilineales bacterium]